MNSFFFILVFDSGSEKQQTFSLGSDNYLGKVTSFGEVESKILCMFAAGKFYSLPVTISQLQADYM